MRLPGFALIAALALAAGACDNEPYGTPRDTTTTPPPPPPNAAVNVGVENFRFVPEAVTITAGQRVTWTNVSNQAHDVVADGGAFQSGYLNAAASGGAGGTFTHTFANVGSFTYHCSIHPEMTGRVTVTAAVP